MQANDLVLVTGATGFIGGRLVEKLIQEHGVRVRVLTSRFSRCSRPARFPVELVLGNLDDPASLARACAGCNIVFHAAFTFEDGRTGPANSNVAGSVALVDAARAAGVRKLVHFSSVAVYGETADGDLTEATPLQPTGGDHYTEVKRAVERAVLERARQNGLSVTAIQPTIVYGPYAGAWTENPLRQVKDNRVVLPRMGEGVCNVVYVDDVCDAAILAGRRDDLAGERFLIAGPDTVTWSEFFQAYQRMAGGHAPENWSTEAVVAEMARRADRKPLPLALVAAIWRRPAVMARLMGFAPFRWAYKTVRWFVPGGRKASLRANLDGPWAVPVPPGPPLLLPTAFALPIYQARTTAKIDRARQQLGYAPRFPFARGIALTGEWARWARLAGPR